MIKIIAMVKAYSYMNSSDLMLALIVSTTKKIRSSTASNSVIGNLMNFYHVVPNFSLTISSDKQMYRNRVSFQCRFKVCASRSNKLVCRRIFEAGRKYKPGCDMAYGLG